MNDPGDSGRLIILPCGSVGIINFRPINLLERLHRADGTDKLKISVITQQITRKIKKPTAQRYFAA
jgi:hypothetical protein